MLGDVARDDGHGHSAGVPATGRQPTEMRLGCLVVRQVKRLGVVLLSELQHLFAGDFIGAKIGLRAHLQIFEIDHGGRIASAAAWREVDKRARLGWWPPKLRFPSIITRASSRRQWRSMRIVSILPSGSSSRTSRKI